MRRVARFVVRPIVIGPLIVVVVATAVGALATWQRTPDAAPRPASVGPLFSWHADAPESGVPTFPPQTPTPTPKPKPKPKPVVRPAGPSLAAFRGLGTWVDLYDYEALVPETAAADMAVRGVKTLYLQTARWNKPDPKGPSAFYDEALMQRWLVAAHAKGLKVVGWYLPAYDDMSRDVARTRAIAEYRVSGGQRFDALGIDIEFKSQMPSLSAWNAAVAEHAARVRAALGKTYPIAAIVPAPLAMQVRPEHWAGFPWHSLASSADLFMPMAYWSYRDDCSADPSHCAYGYTKGSVDAVRSLTGKPDVPVHVIGGVGDAISDDDVAKFVSAAEAAHVDGASLYDYQTTKPVWWAQLAKLN
jgi:hypothetical protein